MVYYVYCPKCLHEAADSARQGISVFFLFHAFYGRYPREMQDRIDLPSVGEFVRLEAVMADYLSDTSVYEHVADSHLQQVRLMSSPTR